MEISHRAGGIPKIEVADTTIDICVRNLILKLDKLVKVTDSFVKLSIQKTRNTSAIVWIGEIRTQLYRNLKIPQCIVIITKTRTCYSTIYIGMGEYRILIYRRCQIGISTNQIIKVILGYSSQKIALISVIINCQEDI